MFFVVKMFDLLTSRDILCPYLPVLPPYIAQSRGVLGIYQAAACFLGVSSIELCGSPNESWTRAKTSQLFVYIGTPLIYFSRWCSHVLLGSGFIYGMRSDLEPVAARSLIFFSVTQIIARYHITSEDLCL